ncbi:hypothetical protein [Zobellia galactanivorans]|uniref:Hypothetical membrane protein n=1 Tax=Zobellia galactanivorans (strain DSM 12802 / CCUG 47099 / CIP 106680 / NCIMB 13871 / Dsij) TaxID=63186 RepID=G0L0L8_ZOBGA|nr:hypothetical protein [Zobellia galactanivorans]CAZ97503.1 Hypothetical membrane protein [Zobellia galactanivorans]
MIIENKVLKFVFLAVVFVMGLVQEIVVSNDDAAFVSMELEHHDNPNDTDSDIDEDVIDFDIPLGQSLLPDTFLDGGRSQIVADMDCDVQTLGASQPTPPPEHIA